MGVYSKLVLPYLTDFAMRDKAALARRSKLVPGAEGIVLEIGIGSGLNLPFYSSAVKCLYAVDPSPELLAMTRKKVERMTFPVDLRCESAERLSLDDRSVDTIVMTWALCTIPDPARALREMGRVLKPQGRMIFIEHGLSPDSGLGRTASIRFGTGWREDATSTARSTICLLQADSTSSTCEPIICRDHAHLRTRMKGARSIDCTINEPNPKEVS